MQISALEFVQANQSANAYRCYSLIKENTVRVIHDGQTIRAWDAQGNALVTTLRRHKLSDPALTSLRSDQEILRLLSGSLGYLFSTDANLLAVDLVGTGWDPWLSEFKAIGAHIGPDGLRVCADMFWQVAPLWSRSPAALFPRHDVYDGRTFYPLRPAKPIGRVYTRFIPWLKGELTFDVATLDDLGDVHRWMNQPRVIEFWQESGDELHHRRYLENMFADPHIIPIIARFEEQAFGYFEVYWAREDLIGPFCSASDYDRGCHVIIGEEAYRGSSWFAAWLPSLLHFMFLDDQRTERIVQEPQADHYRQLYNLQRSGFSRTSTVDLPTKRAAIVEISRRKFFSDRLWHPAVDNYPKTR